MNSSFWSALSRYPTHIEQVSTRWHVIAMIANIVTEMLHFTALPSVPLHPQLTILCRDRYPTMRKLPALNRVDRYVVFRFMPIFSIATPSVPVIPRLISSCGKQLSEGVDNERMVKRMEKFEETCKKRHGQLYRVGCV